jgi:hypothetical protein
VAGDVSMRSAAAQALDDAATAAGHAPSILNTQPWHWRLHGGALHLSVDPSRILEITDPDGRLATVSCGAALHHAVVSLTAGGWRTAVTRAPTSDQGGYLATVRIDGRIPSEPAAVADLRAIGLRHTDRLTIPGVHIDADKLRSIARAAESHGGSLRLLRPDQSFDLAAAADHAVRTETDQASSRSFTAMRTVRWTGCGLARPFPRRGSRLPNSACRWCR